ncbi:hypothetical protein KSP40_PGU022022 [Platanthera guangdongensis]|uniref:Uncharacterized protein n=1 Tax=Platanthera guangdongensis TaxID=2320717 RepID=A0ABR2MBA6_9ASPA
MIHSVCAGKLAAELLSGGDHVGERGIDLWVLAVLSPQSGLIQRMLASSTASILRARSAISRRKESGRVDVVDPGADARAVLDSLANTERVSLVRELDPIVITSASMSMMEWMMSLKLE